MVKFLKFIFSIFVDNKFFLQILPNSSLLASLELVFFGPFFPRLTATINFPCFKFWLKIWVNNVIFSKIPHRLNYWRKLCKYKSLSFSLFFTRIAVLINNWTRSPQGLQVNSPWGEAEWAIGSWPSRAKGLIVLVSPN